MSNLKKQTTIELTKEGLEELKQELNELKNVKLPQVIDRVAIARDHGDLSENSEYQNAKDQQAILESRIDEIEAIILKAKVVKQTTSHTIVGLGSTVEVHLKANKKKKFTFQIVGEFEADPSEGRVSSVSPVGQALMGKKKNEKAVVDAPAGKVNYVVDKIK